MKTYIRELTSDQYAILTELAAAEDWRKGLTEREIEFAARIRHGPLLNKALEGLLDGRYIRERHEQGHLFPTYYIITEKGRRES